MSATFDSVAQIVLRWVHFVAGITWIGLLYYFNMVQSPGFMRGLDAQSRTMIITKLLRRQLNFFRWAALITVVAGILLGLLIPQGQLLIRGKMTWWGFSILAGGLAGLVMVFNVWMIIWPSQQRVIRLTSEAAAAGAAPSEQAAKEIAKYGRRARLASRTNFVLSFFLLFFMGAASHFPLF